MCSLFLYGKVTFCCYGAKECYACTYQRTVRFSFLYGKVTFCYYGAEERYAHIEKTV